MIKSPVLNIRTSENHFITNSTKNRLYMRTHNGFVIIDTNTSKIIKSFSIDHKNIESFWASDDDESIFFNNPNDGSINYIDVKNNKIKNINSPVRGSCIIYISNDTRLMVYIPSNDPCKVIVLLDCIQIYKFDTNFNAYCDGTHIIYISSNLEKLVRYNLFTRTEIYADLDFRPERMFNVNGNILIEYKENIRCYDKKDLQLKYELKDLSGLVDHNDKYIYNALWTAETELVISIYSIDTGEQVSQLNYKSVDRRAIYGDLVLSFDLYFENYVARVTTTQGKKIGAILSRWQLSPPITLWSPNGKYVYTLVDRRRIKSYDVSDLFNTNQKLEFLKGANSPESSIARAVDNPLFDRHLFGEIFDMIGSTIILGD
jgi:hypothetical protein